MGWLGDIGEGLLGAVDAAEAFAGEIPVVGTVVHGAQSLYNTGAAVIDMATGDSAGAADHATDAGIHAVEAIPFLGSILGMGASMYGEEDVHEAVKGGLFGEDIPTGHMEDVPRSELWREQAQERQHDYETSPEALQDDVTHAQLFGTMDDVRAAQRAQNAATPKPATLPKDDLDIMMDQAKAERDRQMDLYIQGKGPEPGPLPSWRELEARRAQSQAPQ